MPKFPKIPGYVVGLSLIGTGVALSVYLREFRRITVYDVEEKIHGKTVIITGASSGIGEATAMDLAKRGGRIIMACRNMHKCDRVRRNIVEKSFNRNVYCKHVNMASLKSIKEFAKDIYKTEPRVDVLINNAGVMRQAKYFTEDGFEEDFAVNYLGPFFLTNLLLDKLKESAPSRVVNLASLYYEKGIINFSDLNYTQTFAYFPKDAYLQSKMAIILFNSYLHKMLEGSKVSTFVVSPPTTKTEIGREMFFYKSQLIQAFIAPIVLVSMEKPEAAIHTIIFCAIDPVMGNPMFSGRHYRDQKEAVETDIVTDEATAKRLWAISESWTKLNEALAEVRAAVR